MCMSFYGFTIIIILGFRLAYCIPILRSHVSEYQTICTEFVKTCVDTMPEFARRSEVHMILHLVEDIVQFGPCSCFCTER